LNASQPKDDDLAEAINHAGLIGRILDLLDDEELYVQQNALLTIAVRPAKRDRQHDLTD